MEIILLRHGKAEPHGNTQGDAARALVFKGEEQSRRAGDFLRVAGILPEIVLTSPLTRAKQTAEQFCRAAQLPGAVVQPWLASGMHPDAALRELMAFQEFKRVCLVGHEPDFSMLLAWVTNSESGAVEVRKGSLILFEIKPPTRSGTLRFIIPQRLMQPVNNRNELPTED